MQMYAAFPLHNVLFSFSFFFGNSALPVGVQSEPQEAIWSPPSLGSPGRLKLAPTPFRGPPAHSPLLACTKLAAWSTPGPVAQTGANSLPEAEIQRGSLRPVHLHNLAVANSRCVGSSSIRARQAYTSTSLVHPVVPQGFVALVVPET